MQKDVVRFERIGARKNHKVKSAHQCSTPMRSQIGKIKHAFNIDGQISLYVYIHGQALNLITNIFHRGGIIHKTETKIGAQKIILPPDFDA